MPNFNISPVTDDELQPVIPAEDPEPKEDKNIFQQFVSASINPAFVSAPRMGRAEQGISV